MKTKRNLSKPTVTLTAGIVETALATRFNADTIPALMEVIHATPNPTVATELLLDIYEMPEIPSTGVISRKVSSNEVYTSEVKKTSFDIWENQVHIVYMTPRVINVKLNKGRVEELLSGMNQLSEVYWAIKHESPDDILFMENCPSDTPYNWYDIVQLEKVPPIENDIYAGPEWKKVLREQSEVVSLDRWLEMVKVWEDLGGVPYNDAGIIAYPHVITDELTDMAQV